MNGSIVILFCPSRHFFLPSLPLVHSPFSSRLIHNLSLLHLIPVPSQHGLFSGCRPVKQGEERRGTKVKIRKSSTAQSCCLRSGLNKLRRRCASSTRRSSHWTRTRPRTVSRRCCRRNLPLLRPRHPCSRRTRSWRSSTETETLESRHGELRSARGWKGKRGTGGKGGIRDEPTRRANRERAAEDCAEDG